MIICHTNYMTRRTITLTETDDRKLARLVKRKKLDASKIMRVALRRLYDEELQANMEEAYKIYYEKPDTESAKDAEDFTSGSAPLW